MIFLITIRNIVRNKKNSFVIALLIAVITFLFFTGNTIINQAGKGLHKTYIESLTGDIVIEKTGDVTMSLFGANAPHLEDLFVMEILPAYNNIAGIINEFSEIESWTPQVSTGARMNVLSKKHTVFLTGVEAKTYFKMLPGIVLTKGAFLIKDEYGVMINSKLAARIEEESGHTLETGMPVTFTTAGKAGFKIREIPLSGIFSYENTNNLLDKLVIADAETVRALAAIHTANDSADVSEKTRVLLDEDAFENLFYDDKSDEYGTADSGNTALENNINDYLNKKDNEGELSDKGGDWNFILIKLLNGRSVSKTITKLNKMLQPYGVTAVDWRTAAGISAILVLFLQSLYNAGIFIVCIAGIIAIINILLIAVFKRTRDIGTLRVLGASDNYIRLLLITENCLLGLIGGVLGIIFGSIAFSVINMMNIYINNDIIVNLLGMEFLHLSFFPEYAALSVIFSVLLTFLSLIFPVEIAVKIEPVIAVREG
jgi:ABC-type lipoprotein release transport system permease subunit